MNELFIVKKMYWFLLLIRIHKHFCVLHFGLILATYRQI